MRLVPLVGVVLLVVVAGCGAPVAKEAPTPNPPESVASETPEPVANTDDPGTTTGGSGSNTSGAERGADLAGPDPGPDFADPDSDVKGWENGYWAEEPIDLDQSDGVDDEERAAVVARSMARVERVRGVEFDRGVDVEVVSREEFASGPVGGGNGNGNGNSPEALYRDARYEALFLLGEDTGSGNATDQNNQQSVQGYYDPGTDEVVLVAPTETPRIDEGTLSQELFHAYQYRHLLPRRIPALATYDGRQAVLSVVEGDANLVQYRYERRCKDEWSCLSRSPVGSSDGSDDEEKNETEGNDARSGGFRVGIYLLQYFPYASGEQYVREVYDRSGWDGVDALYEDFPTTSAAVIHSEDLAATPVELPVPDADGWDLVERPRRGNYGTVGEAGLAGMFAYTLYDDRNQTLVPRSTFLNRRNGSLDPRHPLNYSLDFSDGWRGDRFRVYRNGAGETAYVLRIRFVDDGAATEFASRYRDLLRYQDGDVLSNDTYRIDAGRFADAFAVRRAGSSVTIVNAPSVEELEAVAPPS